MKNRLEASQNESPLEACEQPQDVTVGLFWGIYQLSDLIELWPNEKYHPNLKIGLPFLFRLLLEFFKVDLTSSELDGKCEKALRLVGNRLLEKVKASNRKSLAVKHVDFAQPGGNISKLPLEKFLNLKLSSILDKSKAHSSKLPAAPEQLENVRPSTLKKSLSCSKKEL